MNAGTRVLSCIGSLTETQRLTHSVRESQSRLLYSWVSGA